MHQYELNGYHIVLDESGAVHSVDEQAALIIRLAEDHDAEEVIAATLAAFPEDPGVTREGILGCLEQVNALRAQGKLYSRTDFAPLAGVLKERSGDVVKALCLHVAHTCNLNCAYCFASQGRYHGRRALMSVETGKQALDFLIAHSGSRHHLEVDFFGGEPLMNFETVKTLTAYAREREKDCGKHFRFTLTTNGLLLDDEVTEFCNREMDNVVLSLDGRKEIHDYYRRDLEGRGSYDRVVPRFQRFVQKRGDRQYYIRGTFTHRNPDFMKDILHMLSLGFTKLSMEPVVCAPEDPEALTEEDLAIVKEQYELLALEMLRREKEGRPFTFYHYMLDLKAGPCLYKRLSGCGSGTEYMAVTPWGDLYPCHQFVGEEAFLMGNVRDGVLRPELREEFRACNVYARKECADCWARLYCAGGCAANAYHATGSIRGVYAPGCELFKKRIECAVMLQAAREEA